MANSPHVPLRPIPMKERAGIIFLQYGQLDVLDSAFVLVNVNGVRKPITFSEIDYEGVLTVADPAKLTAALFTGVGKARSYGCGLMLVRPADHG